MSYTLLSSCYQAYSPQESTFICNQCGAILWSHLCWFGKDTYEIRIWSVGISSLIRNELLLSACPLCIGPHCPENYEHHLYTFGRNDTVEWAQLLIKIIAWKDHPAITLDWLTLVPAVCIERIGYLAFPFCDSEVVLYRFEIEILNHCVDDWFC